ncbi:MAG: hypothetical protein Q8O89_08585 [Nanoarchaeota archaeon]|nr:hypothetical protein [Nanoarchaeota archaeon]
MNNNASTIVDRIKSAKGCELGVSIEEIMLEIMRLMPLEDFASVVSLRQACCGFEARNPFRGTDEELNRLVDKNLYFICDVADNFRNTFTSKNEVISYEMRINVALRKTIAEPRKNTGLIKIFYEIATGYKPEPSEVNKRYASQLN